MLSRNSGFLYHVHKGSGSARTAQSKQVAVNTTERGSSARSSKNFYCLEADMAELRSIGSAKGIVDSGYTTVGQSTDGREIHAIKIGNGPHSTVITGCYHAREWISVEVPFLIAEYLVTEYPTGAPANLAQKRLKHLLHNRTVWIVPMVNPDGHELSVTYNRLWRANAKVYRPSDTGMPTNGWTAPAFVNPRTNATLPTRTINYDRSAAAFYKGVDCNRNHGCTDAYSKWGLETVQGRGTSRDPSDCATTHTSGNRVGSQVWCGPSAASEAETQALEQLAATASMKSSLHFHSCFGCYLYSEKFETSSDNFTKWLGRGMQQLNSQTGSPGYQLGTPTDLLGYGATGAADDFFRIASGDRPTYTPEVRPINGAMSAAALYAQMFSFLPESEIWPTFLENLAPALAVINAAGFTDSAGDVDLDTTTNQPATKVQFVKNCWEVFKTSEGWNYPAMP